MSLWGAGFIGPDGTDYVAAEADALRGHMGLGLYSQDPHGAMGQWRDLFAIPLALLRNLYDWMVANANPGTAVDLLPYWERILNLAHGAERMTAAERQQRCKDLLRRWVDTPVEGHPTAVNIYWILHSIHVRALGLPPVSWVATGTAEYTLTMEHAMFDVGNEWWLKEMQRWRDLLCPAWGEIILTV